MSLKAPLRQQFKALPAWNCSVTWPLKSKPGHVLLTRRYLICFLYDELKCFNKLTSCSVTCCESGLVFEVSVLTGSQHQTLYPKTLKPCYWLFYLSSSAHWWIINQHVYKRCFTDTKTHVFGFWLIPLCFVHQEKGGLFSGLKKTPKASEVTVFIFNDVNVVVCCECLFTVFVFFCPFSRTKTSRGSWQRAATVCLKTRPPRFESCPHTADWRQLNLSLRDSWLMIEKNIWSLGLWFNHMQIYANIFKLLIIWFLNNSGIWRPNKYRWTWCVCASCH